MDQTGSRPPGSDCDLLGASWALGRALELLLGLVTELVTAGCRMQSTVRRTSQSSREMVHCCCVEQEKMTLQNDDFSDLGLAREAPT